jgi:hypothetical protein
LQLSGIGKIEIRIKVAIACAAERYEKVSFGGQVGACRSLSVILDGKALMRGLMVG